MTTRTELPPDRRAVVSSVGGSPLDRIGRPDEVDVSRGCDGVVAQWLVHDGDRVDAGDPLARPYPEVSE